VKRASHVTGCLPGATCGRDQLNSAPVTKSATNSLVIFVIFVYDVLDNGPSILASITRLKSDLADIIEPDFGLLDQLLSLEVLTLGEHDDVLTERTVYRRNDALLELLVSEDQCEHFVKALEATGQQHVVNFITQHGGQKRHNVPSFQ